MILRLALTLGIAFSLAAAIPQTARADAGEFLGGAVVGGIVGYAIGKDQQKKKSQRTTTSNRTYRSGIPSTTQGAQTQTALNYFGYNAGRVDGQVGRGTRSAIERYQASMGYPINGYDFQPYQYDFLMQAYYWATSGGQATTQLAGQPLLMAYRRQVQTGSALATAPQAPAQAAPAQPVPVATPQEPEPETTETTSASLPSLFSGGTGGPSLANRCSGVMLQTSTNGGYTTLANMSDPDFALSEQFCLARSYAMARGEDLIQDIQGLTPEQVSAQCDSYGEMVAPQVDALSINSKTEAETQMRKLALDSGLSPQDLAATSKVCLAIGYRQDNMDAALGSALMLVAMGEPAYGELIGHHLREGFGVQKRRDLAMQWYDASLSALDAGSQAVFLPSQTDRPQLLRAAMVQAQ
ncbi:MULTISPECIES: peptidoglycan-binding domain-containing protein [unclassified Ruegeria]|uniref:peptidoglycan-binding domain-containing protein n=1 Tax=unclassified Ruegeria TaxID=2625375 RepID=UPI001492CEFF|nr:MULTISPECIES: peptidoglycan-binding domain-containing protein [unclassified Ruegeria]NOC47614.1 peptidoglycan-binding protein [Ruegeria sp. HKCCD7559]NOD86466.1 peptidoglycan-binding protein [Ruegeria sp. HKCCD6119]